MTYSTHSTPALRFKVGVFTLAGLVLVAIATVLVNDKPFWWRPCQFVEISVEDATGLKTKSPIRSLGIEIGYLKTVRLTETHVKLGICLTAPVEVLPTTRAYIRGEGFLGDKFVELKPVRYLGSSSRLENFLQNLGGKSAYAADAAPPAADATKPGPKGKREIPVSEESPDIQGLVNRVDELVHQMTGLTDNLKSAINPEDLRRTMKQLNQTLENASKTLAPEGGLNQTARRTLAKLEDAVEQMRDLATRVNRGEGSVGMLLNDPAYADEIKVAIKNLNQLLNKVNQVRFVVDLGGSLLPSYEGGRGWFQLGIWPKPDRYYLLGISMDPRGRITNRTTVTTVAGVTQRVQYQDLETTGILFTAMLGKVFFKRLDLSVGALYGDGSASVSLNLGPNEAEDRITLRNDIYIRTAGTSVDDRISLTVQPYSSIYLRAGLESIRIAGGSLPYFVGAGIRFDDEDIKLLFSFL